MSVTILTIKLKQICRRNQELWTLPPKGTVRDCSDDKAIGCLRISCRRQIEHFANVKPNHLLLVLWLDVGEMLDLTSTADPQA
ncbi:MAG: hypothetical protein RID25_03515, partial [Cyclobacteriaceae bacterium]